MNNPKISENRAVVINNNSKLSFDATLVKDYKNHVISDGYVIYAGRVYKSDSNPPRIILKSGSLKLHDVEIAIDVEGLANSWLKSDEIEPRFVRLKKLDTDSQIYLLSVCFVKGGGNDYLVEWIVLENTSMRIAIRDLGDEYPDWTNNNIPDK